MEQNQWQFAGLKITSFFGVWRLRQFMRPRARGKRLHRFYANKCICDRTKSKKTSQRVRRRRKRGLLASKLRYKLLWTAPNRVASASFGVLSTLFLQLLQDTSLAGGTMPSLHLPPLLHPPRGLGGETRVSLVQKNKSIPILYCTFTRIRGGRCSFHYIRKRLSDCKDTPLRKEKIYCIKNCFVFMNEEVENTHVLCRIY